VAVPGNRQFGCEAAEAAEAPDRPGRRSAGAARPRSRGQSRSRSHGRAGSSRRAATQEEGGKASLYRSGSSQSARGVERSHSAGPEERRRQYAWMDSGDESVVEASEEEERVQQMKEERAGHVDKRPLSVRIVEVHAFSDMLRLAPSVKSRASQMPPKELAAVVTAAARVKFYDAEVFQSGLLPAVRRHLKRNRNAFNADEAADLICGLAELNVYDQVIFSKVVEVFAERKQELEDPVRRGRLLAAFKRVSHQGDKDFIDYLAQRVKAERYEQYLREMQGQCGPQIYYGGLRK